MRDEKYRIRVVAMVLMGLLCEAAWGQGSLTPPGAPAASMKTLDQIETRIPISYLPFTILAPGSYYLTTNLTAASGVTGISVNADRVTIDLNGYTLMGSGGDSGRGIYQGASYSSLRVRNGQIAGWSGVGLSGIFAEGRNNMFEALQIYTNNNGVWSGTNARILDCLAYRNAGVGFRTGSGANVSGCSADTCLSGGIYCGNSTVVTRRCPGIR